MHLTLPVALTADGDETAHAILSNMTPYVARAVVHPPVPYLPVAEVMCAPKGSSIGSVHKHATQSQPNFSQIRITCFVLQSALSPQTSIWDMSS